MILNERLSKNLTLISSQTMSFNEDSTAKKVKFIFQFFGEDMVAEIKTIDAERDQGYITGEGSSELWDSFEDQISSTHWDKMKGFLSQHILDHNKEYEI